MDFKDFLKQLADRIEKLKDSITTEEATKNAFIMPFIQFLGYDVFNPLEVVPEFVADIGVKKGEKVDYAIMKDSSPIILIECKHWKDSLDIHDTQLLRYFNVTKAKFAVLTNGINYRFYTDLEEPNIMDEKPFLDISIIELKDTQIEELKKFHKSYFDVENIVNTASFLKYSNEIKNILITEFNQPTESFIRFFVSHVYNGRITEKTIIKFSDIVKSSCQQFLSDAITDRLKAALSKESETSKQESEKQSIEPEKKESAIETTTEEIEGYLIIKSILRKEIDCQRINYRDFKRFFSIIIDRSIKKTICKLYLNDQNKYISFQDDSKTEIKYELNSLDDIYQYSDKISLSAKAFVQEQQ